MYIRRKVFSQVQVESGEVELFSTTTISKLSWVDFSKIEVIHLLKSST